MRPSDPLYLTDSERPLVSPATRRRYRFRLSFRLRETFYTRWFKSAEAVADYRAAHQPDLVVVSLAEE